MKSKQREIKRRKKQYEQNSHQLNIIFYGNGNIGINVDDLLNVIKSLIFYNLCQFQIVYDDFSFIHKNDILNFWYFDIKYLNTFLDIFQDKVMNLEFYSENKKDLICSKLQNLKIKNI